MTVSWDLSLPVDRGAEKGIFVILVFGISKLLGSMSVPKIRQVIYITIVNFARKILAVRIGKLPCPV